MSQTKNLSIRPDHISIICIKTWIPNLSNPRTRNSTKLAIECINKELSNIHRKHAQIISLDSMIVQFDIGHLKNSFQIKYK